MRLKNKKNMHAISLQACLSSFDGRCDEHEPFPHATDADCFLPSRQICGRIYLRKSFSCECCSWSCSYLLSFNPPVGGRGFRPFGLLGFVSVSDCGEHRCFSVLRLDNLAVVNHLFKQSGSLLTGDAESITDCGCSQRTPFFKDCENVSLDSDIFLLCLSRTSADRCFPNGLASTLDEEVKVFLCQSFVVDAVDSFADSHFFHNLITSYLSFLNNFIMDFLFCQRIFWLALIYVSFLPFEKQVFLPLESDDSCSIIEVSKEIVEFLPLLTYLL